MEIHEKSRKNHENHENPWKFALFVDFDAENLQGVDINTFGIDINTFDST